MVVPVKTTASPRATPRKTWKFVQIFEFLATIIYFQTPKQKPNSMWFLGTILRVLRLEVSIWVSWTIGNGVLFSIRFFSFLLYPAKKLNFRNCKRLREFEEIGKSVDCE
jgi:hypothetical protein